MLEKFKKLSCKRGMALTELLVALALLSVVTTMIVSFSAVAKEHVEVQQSQYTFLEETSQIKHALSQWLAQMDEETVTCTVEDGVLSVASLGASAAFQADALILTDRNGTVSRVNTQTVTAVQFALKSLSADSAIVKCTVTGTNDNRDLYTQSFLLHLRCGSFTG